MASIEIDHASVSYFLRKKGAHGNALDTGSVGAQIIIAKRYLEIAALRDVSLTLRDGDRVGLIGTNGSGKSTMLKLCAGALAAQSGSIRIDGRVHPQFSLGTGIKAGLSGRRNAELKCLYLGTAQSAIPARVEEIKQTSGLGGYFELPVHTYSAGMRSRLVMSLMRIVRAEILIMDEWIGAADATVNSTASSLQKDLMGSASIVLLASHSERLLSQWCNRVVWLEKGEVRAEGPAEEIFALYRQAVRPPNRRKRKPDNMLTPEERERRVARRLERRQRLLASGKNATVLEENPTGPTPLPGDR